MDISTNYLGLELSSPVVASAGPLSREIANIKLMEDNGAGAVVLYSLFEEQIENDQLELHSAFDNDDSFAEATTYFPNISEFKLGPEGYLEHIRKAKEAVDIPVIASLNGKSLGGWVDYAKRMEEAGANALELNIYRLAADIHKSGAEVEKEYLEIIKAVKSYVKIPVAVKTGPFFSSMAWMAMEMEKAGADGLVLFNRFYQPDIDLENLEVFPNVILSTPMAIRLPLRWIAILYGKVKLHLAANSGIYSEKDVLKMVMAGASVTEVLSCLLKFGISHISKINSEMKKWMEENEYVSLEQMRGSMSYMNFADPSQFERTNYMNVINSYKARV